MVTMIFILLLKIIYNFENEEMYYQCAKPNGCKGWLTTLIGCNAEIYSFKLNTTKCEEIKGKIDYYFCDNYIEKDDEFTLETCSPSDLRGCSHIPCFNGKGMIRDTYDCKTDKGNLSHIKHKYYPHYQNFSIIKSYIDFGIPQQLNSFDNSKIVCSFETQKDLIDYLVWTVKDKFVYISGGGHASDFYGRPSKGTGERCPNDLNVTGFDSSGLVLYMMKMLGNRVNLGGSDCQKIYEIGKRLGLIKSEEDSIKAGDVLLFGNDDYKYHAAIAISKTMALEAYKNYEDENCTGMPILTRPIDEIRRLYKNGKVYVVDFLQKKTFIDGEKYLRDENIVEANPIVIKSMYNLHCNDDLCYLLINSISLENGEVSSFVIIINISSNKKLRNLEENYKIKFYCDFNNSEKKENISELILINYNCSTEPFDNLNLNLTEEDNLIESIELENKEEEKYFDLSNVNKRMNISQISNNESSFKIENLTNYYIFTCHENKTINLTNETSFIIEGTTNQDLSEDINFILSFNNTNDFHMNCIISMNDSSLYCLFNESNLKTDSIINIYSIKENEIYTNDKNLFLVGLNKVEFIFEKKEEKEEKEEKTGGMNLFIIIILIVFPIIILISILIIIIFFIRKKKISATIKDTTNKAEESDFSNKKIGMNGSSRENVEIKNKKK